MPCSLARLAVLLCAAAPLVTLSAPTTEAGLTYLASPQFRVQLEADAAARTATGDCRSRAEQQVLLQVHSVQDIVAAPGQHPSDGLWFVQYTEDLCGSQRLRNAFFAARQGAAPLRIDLPDGAWGHSLRDFQQALAHQRQ